MRDPGDRRPHRRRQGLPVRRPKLENPLDGGRHRRLAARPQGAGPPVSHSSARGSDKAAVADAERGRNARGVRQSDQAADRGQSGGARRRPGDEGYGGAALRLLRMGSRLERRQFQRKRRRRRSGRGSGEGHRDWLPTATRACAARLQSKSIMSTPPTANSAMSRISSPTTPAGTFDISSSRPGTGGRARPSGWRPTR